VALSKRKKRKKGEGEKKTRERGGRGFRPQTGGAPIIPGKRKRESKVWRNQKGGIAEVPYGKETLGQEKKTGFGRKQKLTLLPKKREREQHQSEKGPELRSKKKGRTLLPAQKKGAEHARPSRGKHQPSPNMVRKKKPTQKRLLDTGKKGAEVIP